MLKWVGRVLYGIFIIFLTAQVFSFSYFSRLQAYYDDHVRDALDDDEVFLLGINTLLQTNYIRQSPTLYTYESTEGDYQFKLSIFAVSASENDMRYDGFMIFVNRLNIIHDGQLLENPILKINFTLDLETLTVGDSFTNEGSVVYNPTQPFAFYNLPTVFLFDTEKYLKSADGSLAEITSISLNYSDGTLDDQNQYIFSADPFFLATTYPTGENVLGDHKDQNFMMDPALYRLSDVFENTFPSETEIEALQLFTDRESLSPYNILIIRTMGLYILVISGITYLIFFHKKVRETLAIRKAQKNNDRNTVEAPIFKD